MLFCSSVNCKPLVAVAAAESTFSLVIAAEMFLGVVSDISYRSRSGREDSESVSLSLDHAYIL